MMDRTTGLEKSPVWLLGDSNPTRFQNELEGPLDRRHPARHSIWTPIEEVIQRHLFQQCRSRMTHEPFIRNAVGDSSHKFLKGTLAHEIAEYGRLLSRCKPVVVLCFGEFAFEFACRAQQEAEQEEGQAEFRSRSVKQLAMEFDTRVSSFQVEAINVLPLLHASVARGKFLYCHREFSGGKGNYFDYVGGEIANILIEYRSHKRLEDCWT